ncbi:MAG: putative selenium-dependent hydroxylase accessory protein YqeC [Clostridiales bacterium]|nr:putative selenium-dependent hydroxylase accessory protein YqeC [Clostridiales bacterium]
MKLSTLLKLTPGDRVAVVGCGGKTALIDRLALEAAESGVLIAPTTRIGLDQMMDKPGIAYLGRAEGSKLCAVPLEEILAASKEYALTLMEADGSAGLPLKGWASHEPVVPSFATMTIGVVSARAVGLAAIPQNAHRLPLFLAQSGLSEGYIVDEAAVARMIGRCMERNGMGRKAILINQADNPGLCAVAGRIARLLDRFEGLILIGSLREGGTWSVN